jgi:hypothetical protein
LAELEKARQIFIKETAVQAALSARRREQPRAKVVELNSNCLCRLNEIKGEKNREIEV